jgi:AcrR family transcriptional regulator
VTQPAPSGPGRPRDPNAGRAIIRATLELIRERGYAGLRVAEVAERAGVSKATLYRRWSSKTELVVAALHSSPPLEPIDSGDLRADLVALARQFLSIVESTPLAGLLAALAAERQRDPAVASLLDPFVRDRTRPLLEALQRAVARGEVPPTADLESGAALVGGPVITRVLFGGPTDPASIARIVDLAVAGLQASGSAASDPVPA